VICGQSTEGVKAAENKSQLSPREQSTRRDQVYVHQLLQRGTADAKIESVLQLSSRFASFNPTGDFMRMPSASSPNEKAALSRLKQTQQASVGAQAPTAVSDSSPVASGAIAFAPSNPVGINSVKSSQESNREPAQDAVPTTTPTTIRRRLRTLLRQASEAGYFFPLPLLLTEEAPLRPVLLSPLRTLTAQQVLVVRPLTNQVLPVFFEWWVEQFNTFNSDQGPGPGPIGPGPGWQFVPAPPSVGATVPLTYFGPPPSETNPSLVGLFNY